MKTLKPIINALLILLMAIYGLAMLALLILPFVDVTSLFPGAEVQYLSGWGYWLVAELQFAFYLALIWLPRQELKAFTWKALWTEDLSFLEKGCPLNLCAISLEYLPSVGNDRSPSNGLQHISLALLGLSSL